MWRVLSLLLGCFPPSVRADEAAGELRLGGSRQQSSSRLQDDPRPAGSKLYQLILKAGREGKVVSTAASEPHAVVLEPEGGEPYEDDLQEEERYLTSSSEQHESVIVKGKSPAEGGEDGLPALGRRRFKLRRRRPRPRAGSQEGQSNQGGRKRVRRPLRKRLRSRLLAAAQQRLQQKALQEGSQAAPAEEGGQIEEAPLLQEVTEISLSPALSSSSLPTSSLRPTRLPSRPTSGGLTLRERLKELRESKFRNAFGKRTKFPKEEEKVEGAALEEEEEEERILLSEEEKEDEGEGKRNDGVHREREEPSSSPRQEAPSRGRSRRPSTRRFRPHFQSTTAIPDGPTSAPLRPSRPSSTSSPSRSSFKRTRFRPTFGRRRPRPEDQEVEKEEEEEEEEEDLAVPVVATTTLQSLVTQQVLEEDPDFGLLTEAPPLTAADPQAFDPELPVFVESPQVLPEDPRSFATESPVFEEAREDFPAQTRFFLGEENPTSLGPETESPFFENSHQNFSPRRQDLATQTEALPEEDTVLFRTETPFFENSHQNFEGRRQEFVTPTEVLFEEDPSLTRTEATLFREDQEEKFVPQPRDFVSESEFFNPLTQTFPVTPQTPTTFSQTLEHRTQAVTPAPRTPQPKPFTPRPQTFTLQPQRSAALTPEPRLFSGQVFGTRSPPSFESTLTPETTTKSPSFRPQPSVPRPRPTPFTPRPIFEGRASTPISPVVVTNSVRPDTTTARLTTASRSNRRPSRPPTTPPTTTTTESSLEYDYRDLIDDYDVSDYGGVIDDYDPSYYEDEKSVLDKFRYGYSVAAEDGNFHERTEARDGKRVQGSYKVALPDGRTQIVTYVADDDGFHADVTYEGESILDKESVRPDSKFSVQPRPPAPRPSPAHRPATPPKAAPRPATAPKFSSQAAVPTPQRLHRPPGPPPRSFLSTSSAFRPATPRFPSHPPTPKPELIRGSKDTESPTAAPKIPVGLSFISAASQNPRPPVSFGQPVLPSRTVSPERSQDVHPHFTIPGSRPRFDFKTQRTTIPQSTTTPGTSPRPSTNIFTAKSHLPFPQQTTPHPQPTAPQPTTPRPSFPQQTTPRLPPHQPTTPHSTFEQPTTLLFTSPHPTIASPQLVKTSGSQFYPNVPQPQLFVPQLPPIFRPRPPHPPANARRHEADTNSRPVPKPVQVFNGLPPPRSSFRPKDLPRTFPQTVKPVTQTRPPLFHTQHSAELSGSRPSTSKEKFGKGNTRGGLSFIEPAPVSTPSPNPFKLVIDKDKASTFTPAPPISSTRPRPHPHLPTPVLLGAREPVLNFKRELTLSHRSKSAHQDGPVQANQVPSVPKSLSQDTKKPQEAPTSSTTQRVKTQSKSPFDFSTSSSGTTGLSFVHKGVSSSFSTQRPTLTPRTESPPSSTSESTSSTSVKVTSSAPEKISIRTSPSTSEKTSSSTSTSTTESERHVSSTSTTESTVAKVSRLPPFPTFRYTSQNDGRQTALYTPVDVSTVFLRTKGRTHQVPLLLPLNHHKNIEPQPGAFSITDHTLGSILNLKSFSLMEDDPQPSQYHEVISSPEGGTRVEITKGVGGSQPLTLKVPAPHESDIYPRPRPRLQSH
ncbi:uncharacterized protein LOC143029776 isoform X2 [Oratosquilla oratoria]|uniref:uncharacterized protein LOC143029776 isoform X2 n=1 Tax=Oratosquilla oratoria TaxID=337810 RepID=UPI003F758528